MKLLSRAAPARAEPYLQAGAPSPLWPDEAAARFAAAVALFPTIEAAADTAALTTGQLTAHVRGRSAPAFPVVARLADGAGVRLQWIWSGEEPMMRAERMTAEPESVAERPAEPRDPRTAFVVLPHDDAAEDPDGEACGSDQVVDTLAFRADWLKHRLGRDASALFLFQVEGDAMEPTLRDGDLALCDRVARSGDGTIADAGLYALADGGRIVVRRLQRRIDGGVLLLSDSAHYQTETVHAAEAAGLRILGRIVWHGRTI